NDKDRNQKAKNVSLLIELNNTCTGIDTELVNIWQGNLKVDSLHKKQSYTFFNLATCKRLVEINGGEMEAESQLGKGSKFWFTWNIE
ncbi:35958_t:CDS:2, partial [Racocetra persica]